MNPGLVVLVGLLVVFTGLIIIIIAIGIMNKLIALLGKMDSKSLEQAKSPEEQSVQPTTEADDIDHDTLIAIIVASIAAETNTDAAGMRIVSLKRI